MLKINYPWEKPEPRVLLFRPSPDATDVLRKARVPRPRAAFDRLVDVLSSTAGRQQYRRLLRDIADGVRVRRTSCIVGVAR